MDTKIYIVESSEGEWDDHCSWVEKAFRRKEDAEGFARQLDEEHFPQPVFDKKLCEEAERSWYVLNEEKNGSNWEVCPYNWQTEREKCEQFIKQQDEREIAFLLDYINSHSKRQYTTADIIRHQHYEEYRGYNWYLCSVKEIILVEQDISRKVLN